MIRSFRGYATAAVLCMALTAGGCGKKKVDTPAPPPAPAPAPPPAAEPTKPAPPPAPTPAPPPPRALTEDEIFEKATVEELNKQGVLSDAFFAVDSVELNQESRSAIQKNGEYLKRRASTKILVEGHADSRGTN
jgi:outer membrane protein OmpA-like peptidoglycan-associated protein